MSSSKTNLEHYSNNEAKTKFLSAGSGFLQNKISERTYIAFSVGKFTIIMEIKIGHFAIIKNEGKNEKTIIEELTFFNGKLVEIRCSFLEHKGHKGFYPKEILQVIENPDADTYIAERDKAQKQTTRYMKTTTEVIPLKYPDGYLNNFS